MAGPASPPRQKRLLFVSPRFLFPADSGGKIRTGHILRGMKGGRYEITLVSPVPAAGRERFAPEIGAVCDRFAGWPEPRRGRAFPVTRLRHLVSPLPVPVATDRSRAGRRVVKAALAGRPDVVVFDFPHATVLAPPALPAPSVLFTHNVESEIFQRHAAADGSLLRRALWRSQLRKMERFEGNALARFDTVVAVSERDAERFRRDFGVARAEIIPTGVDVDWFTWTPPEEGTARIAFTGSMDWLPNVDAMSWFLDEAWDLVARAVPGASLRVIGRAPPAWLVEKARARGVPWSFTGFVDDVRPHVRGSSAFIIPMRLGGGTRLKVYEAMALGCPVVSTSTGVEGLPLEPDRHYLRADTPEVFAAAVVRLLRDNALRQRLSRDARRLVEERFTFRRAAEAFEEICRRTEAGGGAG